MNGIINAVIGVIQAVWSTIVNFVGSVVNFVVGVWNAFVGVVLGPAIEMVKSILVIIIGTIVNTIVNPLFSNDILSNNPPILNPYNSTNSQSILNETISKTTSVVQGFNENIYNFIKSPVLPNIDLQIPLDGLLGDLIKMSGPFIIQEIISEVANIIVSKVFIGILGIDKISQTDTDITNFNQSLTGFSVDQLQNMFDFSIDQVFNEPNLISNLITNLLSKVNPLTLNYTDSSSNSGSSVLGYFFRANLNIDFSISNTFSSLLGLSSNISTQINRDAIKSSLKTEFLDYIIFKVSNEINGILESMINPQHPVYLKAFIAFVHASIGFIVALSGITIQQQIDQLGDGFIISEITIEDGVQEFITGLLDGISLLLVNPYYTTCEVILDSIDFFFGIAKIITAIVNFLNSNIFGKIYAFFTILQNGLDLYGLLATISEYASNNKNIQYAIKPVATLANLIQTSLPFDEKWVPVIKMGLDILQLFIGEIYIAQL